MDPIESAAALLLENRLAPAAFAGLPDGLRPPDLSTAYAIQARLHPRLARAGWGRIGGWKIGCTTPVMQAYLGIAHPCAGGMTEATVFDGSGDMSVRAMRRPGVECEIGVRIARDLAAGEAERGALLDAIEGVVAAIEIVDDRYADFGALGAPTLIADDFFHAGAVLGRPAPGWRDVDLMTVEGTLSLDGIAVDGGRGDAIMGHPLEALAWLAADLGRRGMALRRGDRVMLGSVVKTRWVPRGTRVGVDFGPLGRAEVVI
jgi:2-oxo-3-hexenedioate decarboxylase/2-keto-4-pentenoate hydratase